MSRVDKALAVVDSALEAVDLVRDSEAFAQLRSWWRARPPVQRRRARRAARRREDEQGDQVTQAETPRSKAARDDREQ